MRPIDGDALVLKVQRHGILLGDEDATDEERERYMLRLIASMPTLDMDCNAGMAIDWCRKKMSEKTRECGFTGKRGEGYREAMRNVMSYLHSVRTREG